MLQAMGIAWIVNNVAQITRATVGAIDDRVRIALWDRAVPNGLGFRVEYNQAAANRAFEGGGGMSVPMSGSSRF